MTKILFTIVGLAVLTALVIHDKWTVTFTTSDYEISTSFVLFIVALLALLWLLCLLKKPFVWISRYQNWRKNQKQLQKEKFIFELLNTLLNHDASKYDLLLQQAQKLYGAGSQETALVTALIKPSEEIFDTLNKEQTTKMAGIYGLIQAAEKEGNFDQVTALLDEIPSAAQNMPWVNHTKWRLALMRSDWSEALRLLENTKKSLSPQVYKSHKAALLVKLGRIKEAYKLNPVNPAIALLYVQTKPTKAKRILEKAWKQYPCWPVYTSYKKAIANLPEKKRLQSILDLTKPTRDQRYSLLARADMDIDLQNWARAKENLEIYVQNYPLTRQVADMMAKIERSGLHHERMAQEWEDRSIESEDDSVWYCTKCDHVVTEWHPVCPHCGEFDSIFLK